VAVRRSRLAGHAGEVNVDLSSCGFMSELRKDSSAIAFALKNWGGYTQARIFTIRRKHALLGE